MEEWLQVAVGQKKKRLQVAEWFQRKVLWTNFSQTTSRQHSKHNNIKWLNAKFKGI